MRKSIVLIFIMSFCLLAGMQARAAGPMKLKFVQSIYEGKAGVGLNHPEGVACTEDTLVVADTGNNRLLKYVYGQGTVEAQEFEMPVTAPLIVQLNSKGEIYALDGRDRKIFILNPDGTPKGQLSPKGSPVSRNMVPKSFRIAQDDKIYILDISDDVVLVLDPAGNYLRHITFPEQFGFLSDLAVDRGGTVFVVDSTKASVYSASQDAEQLSPLGRDLHEYVNFPTNIALDAGGILYLVDKHGGSLALLGRDGSFLGHKFGYGWKESQFYYPAQLCITEGGHYFVADRNNNRVEMFETEE